MQSLGSTLDNMNNLGPWNMAIQSTDTDNECNKYTIVGVTGFLIEYICGKHRKFPVLL